MWGVVRKLSVAGGDFGCRQRVSSELSVPGEGRRGCVSVQRHRGVWVVRWMFFLGEGWFDATMT